MSNPVSNAIFDFIFKKKPEHHSIVFCIYESDYLNDALTFKRMAESTSVAPQVVLRRHSLTEEFGVFLQESDYIVFFGNADNFVHSSGRFVSTDLLSQNDPDFGFFQEMQAHDFELGGVIEWNESVSTQYSSSVLQSLSAVHIKRFFPWEAWTDLKQISAQAGDGRLRCLDIGCGPISKARYGALQDWLYIVGVDPLNDIYSAIISRHGLDGIKNIRPNESITGFAEELDFSKEPFNFIYSCNALDHTQDLERSIKHILDSMAEKSIAYIVVYTKEGERQSYQGLHKFNVWCENNKIMFNSEGVPPRALSSIDERIQVGKIYSCSESITSFSLVR